VKHFPKFSFWILVSKICPSSSSNSCRPGLTSDMGAFERLRKAGSSACNLPAVVVPNANIDVCPRTFARYMPDLFPAGLFRAVKYRCFFFAGLAHTFYLHRRWSCRDDAQTTRGINSAGILRRKSGSPL
jgi:hypothetical protein